MVPASGLHTSSYQASVESCLDDDEVPEAEKKAGPSGIA